MNSGSMERMAEQHAFPTAAVLLTLTAAAAVTGAGAFALVSQTVGAAAARPAVLFAVLVAWVSSLLAVVPLALAAARGVTATIVAYFIGMMGRLLICLAAALVAVGLLKLPATPTLLSMAAAYLVLLLIEVAFVGRYLMRRDSMVEPDAGSRAPLAPGREVTAR